MNVEPKAWRHGHVRPQTRQRAQALRHRMTESEVALWSLPQRRQVGGFKFRRQHPVEPYIVDFYCHEAKLAVEVDGETHIGKREADVRRSAFLESRGLCVLRFTTEDVFRHPRAVCQVIECAALERAGGPPSHRAQAPPPAPPQRGGELRAFTLVELLVVVTIIVILLALIAPAMDRAIYSAELTVCMTKLKAISTGMNAYAAGAARWYPYNEAYAQGSGWHAPLLSNGGATAMVGGVAVGTGKPFDERPLLSGLFALNKTLIDPMIRPIDVEGSTANLVYGSYSLWNTWSWRATASASNKRMAKVGDRFTYKDLTGGPEYAFDILAGDFMRAVDPFGQGGATPGQYWTCHPTKGDGSRLILQNGPTTYGTISLYSYWVSNAPGRPPVDYNVAHQDGSVRTLADVEGTDERLVDAPEYYTGPGSLYLYHQMPAR